MSSSWKARFFTVGRITNNMFSIAGWVYLPPRSAQVLNKLLLLFWDKKAQYNEILLVKRDFRSKNYEGKKSQRLGGYAMVVPSPHAYTVKQTFIYIYIYWD